MKTRRKTKTEPTPDAEMPLRLVWMSPAELAENPRNWRRHEQNQLAALSDIISEVGWAGACLLNEKTGKLIDGHARKKVALDQGTEKVPVLVGSWSEEDEAKILLSLDPLASMATADAAALEALLADVSTSSQAVQDMLDGLREQYEIQAALPIPGGGGDDFDSDKALEGPCRVQSGDLWVIGGKHRLLCGDSTKAEDVARVLGDARPNLMVTDPPYGVQYEPQWRNEAAKNGHLAYVASRVGEVANDNREDWTEAYKLFPGNVVYCWHADPRASSIQQHLLDAGFEVRCQIVWAKQGFVISRGHYHWQHEPCWYAVRKDATANWCGNRSQTTLWEIGTNAGEGKNNHGTQKPIECMARPIRNHEGDVYDPFLGSGTTLIAAHRLNRICHGIEIEPKYVEVALQRAEAEGLTVEKSNA